VYTTRARIPIAATQEASLIEARRLSTLVIRLDKSAFPSVDSVDVAGFSLSSGLIGYRGSMLCEDVAVITSIAYFNKVAPIA
jgi:hypothetical protein